MENKSNLHHADPELLMGWLAARSIARGLPQPVPDQGGLRVDVGLPTENRRYVFAHPTNKIRELAQAIDAPSVFIKLCGTGEQLLALVPPRWQLQAASYLTTCRESCDARQPLPDGYQLEVSLDKPATVARIVAADGSLAASGYAVEYGGFFVYDRIVTEAAHQRLGLGKAVMAALDATRRSSTSQKVLVATEDGRALYSKLGWTVHSPYATAVIPALSPVESVSK